MVTVFKYTHAFGGKIQVVHCIYTSNVKNPNSMLNAFMLCVVHGATCPYDTFAMMVLDLEPVASHACLVLGDKVGALLLGVVRCREQHAFVALCFLIGAHAARLLVLAVFFPPLTSTAYLVLRLRRGGVLKVCAHVGGGRWCCSVSAIRVAAVIFLHRRPT